jgi:hypothetical protein
MLADDIADRIAAACHLGELGDIVRDAYCHHIHGRLTENEIEILDEAARTRREAIQARRQAARREPENFLHLVCLTEWDYTRTLNSAQGSVFLGRCDFKPWVAYVAAAHR